MTRKLLALALSMAVATPALAGSPTPPLAEPPVAAPPAAVPPPMPAGRDWTGGYLGARLGFGDLGSGVSGSGAIGGLYAGYLYDFGGFAAGVEAGYDAARINVNLGGRLEEVARIGLRAGPTLGDVFFYGTAGAARAKVSTVGSDSGWYGGLGAEVALDPNWSVGGEFLHHRFRNFNGTGVNVTANTLQARVSFRF